jgi:hypothetical protein
MLFDPMLFDIMSFDPMAFDPMLFDQMLSNKMSLLVPGPAIPRHRSGNKEGSVENGFKNITARIETEILPGLPDGIFSNQKSTFLYILEGLALGNFGIYHGYLVYFMSICYIL